MSYSSALPRQSDTLSPDPKQGFAATDWAGLRKQLILLHPVARQLVGNSDTRSGEQHLWGAIHGAAEDVSAICDAVGRNKSRSSRLYTIRRHHDPFCRD
jgi:hypothetical protein